MLAANQQPGSTTTGAPGQVGVLLTADSPLDQTDNQLARPISPTWPVISQQQQQKQQQQQQHHNQQHNQQQPLLAQQVCAPQLSSRNLAWNATRLGLVARQSCPEGAVGRASWLCDVERQRFVPLHSPDFSQCQSIWLNRLAGQLDQMLELPANNKQQSELIRQQNQQVLRAVLADLALMARTKELYAEDLKRMDIMMSQILAQLKSMSMAFGSPSSLAADAGNNNNQLESLYEHLFGKLGLILSSLFEPQQRSAWLELPTNDQRRRLELRLMNHLKEAGLLLLHSLDAETIQMASQTNRLAVRQANVAAGLSVITNNNNLNLDPATGDVILAMSTQQNRLDFDASAEEAAERQQDELRLSGGLAKELLSNGKSFLNSI